MWTALAVAALGLAPEQAGQLTLDNVRYTRGVLGPARGNSKVLPGESLYLCFDVEGVTADESGKARYSIGLEVSNADGKVIFKQDPREQQVTLSLGAGRIPAFANINTAAAVNCLEIEPASKMLSGLIGTSCSRSAMPYPFCNTG